MVTTPTVTATVTANGVTRDLDELTAVIEHLPYPIPEATAFAGTRGYLRADDLAAIAEQLIREYHQHIGHVAAYTIDWLWRGKASRRGWTKPAKDLLGHYAADVDFVIWLGADVLREEQFTHGQVRKQVFHELLHIVEDDKGKVGVRADHDFEGYVVELELFGPWTAELSRAKRAFEQAPPASLGPLFDRGDDDDEEGDDRGR